jgi:hypothetical protein
MSAFSLSKRRSSICSRASSLDSACVLSDVEERTKITSDDDNDDDEEDDDREEEASKAKFREFS